MADHVCYKEDIGMHNISVPEIHKKFNPASRRYEDCDKWISVKEKLPDFDGSYLTLNIGGWGATNYLNSDGKGQMIRKYNFIKKIFTSAFGHRQVTHWMPLPPVPKDK